MKNLKNATALYDMINSGQIMEAYEKFYHQDVVMQEIGEAPRNGKDTNREYEQIFLGMIKELRGGGVKAITSNETENITMVESWMELIYHNNPDLVKIEQVAVQTWQGDLIIKEVFYHR